MAWRVTYVDGGGLQGFLSTNSAFTSDGILNSNSPFKANARVELREDTGQIARLAPGAEFQILETPMGMRPEYYGEVAILRKGRNCGKYRTSCFLVPVPADEHVDVYMKPGQDENTDDFLVFSGCMAITEYDEDNRAYGICFVKQGERVTLSFDPNLSGSKRYKVKSTVKISDAEYDAFLDNYLDPRKWQ